MLKARKVKQSNIIHRLFHLSNKAKIMVMLQEMMVCICAGISGRQASLERAVQYESGAQEGGLEGPLLSM